jgi:hypothetical protein
LAKLERPTNATDRGGWVELSENPVKVIEEYLKLVNEHLPESISEEVISELRTYMIETAEDLGEGEITLKSAKKVVAQFGAPSEVADEYKYSMLPETIPEKQGMTSVGETTDKSIQDSDSEKEKQEPRRTSTSSPVGAFLQTASITLLWATLIAITSTLVGPIWIVLDGYFILVIQVVIVIGFLMVNIYNKARQKLKLWDRDYPEWSAIQRYLTLPENVMLEASDFMLVVDIVGALLGVALLLISTFATSTPYYIPIILIPGLIVLLAKSFYSGRRIGSKNPLANIKAEVTSTFFALLFVDSAQIWIRWYSVSFSRLLFGSYTIIWGSVLLLQLVVRSGDLWWDTDDPETSIIDDQKSAILHQTNHFAGRTILRLIGWIGLFSLIPTYCLFISQYVYAPWFAPLWIDVFFGPIIMSPMVLYFFFRRWLIHRGSSVAIIGERSRIEALADLLLLSFLLFGFISGIQTLIEPNYLLEPSRYILDDFGFTGMMYFFTGYLSSILLLFIGVSMRIIVDCLEFRENRKSAIQLMIISGMILITSLTIRVGIDILVYNYVLFSFTYYSVILFLATVITFQVETSKVKLKILNGTSSTSSQFMHTLVDTKVESPSMNNSPEQKKKYLGN